MHIFFLAWFLICLNPLAAEADGPDPYEAPAVIQDAVTRFIESDLRHQYSKYEIELGAMDPRLKLNRCESALDIFFPPGQRLSGPVTVGVRCQEPKPWQIYLRAKVMAFGPVIVTRKSLKKGMRIGADDIDLKEMELTRIHQEVFTNPAEVIGQEILKSVAAGSLLTAQKLTSPKAVRRGEQVTILAKSDGMQIRVKGAALSDGMTGQTIAVKNLSSDRVVEGIVTGPGIVQIQF
jgi:flagellar basal body P-ring formation protein FlgA